MLALQDMEKKEEEEEDPDDDGFEGIEKDINEMIDFS